MKKLVTVVSMFYYLILLIAAVVTILAYLKVEPKFIGTGLTSFLKFSMPLYIVVLATSPIAGIAFFLGKGYSLPKLGIPTASYGKNSDTFFKNIPFSNLWRVNHWHSNYARIVGDKMIFTGASVQTKEGEDGSHIDLNYILEIGKTYEISCFAKSYSGTTGMFQLWCHDNTGLRPLGVDVKTDYKIPLTEGEVIKLNFKADYNESIRIHLQYRPGEGGIEISDVRIVELNI